MKSTILIIGSSSGIGQGISHVLAEKAETLLLHGRSMQKLELLKKEIQIERESQKIPRIELIEYTFSKKSIDYGNFFDKLDHFHCPDIIIVCYGPFLEQFPHEIKESDLKRIFEHNAVLPAMILQHYLVKMRDRGGGNFIFFGGTGSDAIRAYGNSAIYHASKLALVSLARSVAESYAHWGIRCNIISPGIVDTQSPENQKILSRMEKNSKKYLLNIQEVVDGVLYMLYNSEINGEIMRIDKGFMPKNRRPV